MYTSSKRFRQAGERHRRLEPLAGSPRLDVIEYFGAVYNGHMDQAKARKTITVPLSDMAVAVLRRQRATKHKAEYVASVFVYHGKQVYQPVATTWTKRVSGRHPRFPLE